MLHRRETEDMLMLLAGLAKVQGYQTPAQEWADRVADMAEPWVPRIAQAGAG